MMKRSIAKRSLAAVLTMTLGMLLAFSNVSAQGSSSPTLQRIAKTETLKVGMSAAQPPFNLKNRDGNTIGMDVDLAGLLAVSMGVKLEIVELPFADLLGALEAGKVDLVVSGMTATLERNTRVPFVGPYYISGMSILTTSQALAAAQSTEQLNQSDLRLAVLKGSTSEKFAKTFLGKAKITSTRDHAEAVALLKEGKVGAVIADAPVAALSVLRNPDAGFVVSDPLTVEPIGIAVAPGDPLLVNLVENYVDALAATGALEALIKKWFSDSSWMAQMP